MYDESYDEPGPITPAHVACFMAVLSWDSLRVASLSAARRFQAFGDAVELSRLCDMRKPTADVVGDLLGEVFPKDI